MSANERRLVLAADRARQSMLEVGRDVRLARLGRGLSQARVAHAAGLTQSQVSSFERGRWAPRSVTTLARLCSAVGLDLSIRTYPAQPAIRDASQVRLLRRLRDLLPDFAELRTEVPLELPRDQRAWDAVVEIPGRMPGDPPSVRIHVEAETRLRDVQAVTRRVLLKKRDDRAGRVVLLLADTRSNRSAVRAAAISLAADFPVPPAPTLIALRTGRDPGGDGLVFL